MADTNSKLCNRTVVVATKEQVSCDLGGEAAILGMKNSVYYGLNPVGARVWQLLQEPRSVQEICGTIVSEYDVTAERAESDLLQLLQQMLSEGLVELSAADGQAESYAPPA
ncbi:MAG TPA: PqqD family protein [Candidatus Acidoferrales bacterium]|nr:PqqD family protein [Candidatus Acidoferrales bacterium]